ncbi:hypothetical protein DAMA08_000840 [Martiniozyma asiatica (nom. inval.)]|nr:hypothetical protein DAMA08_000840 [Martiniozyma asiatica]
MWDLFVISIVFVSLAVVLFILVAATVLVADYDSQTPEQLRYAKGDYNSSNYNSLSAKELSRYKLIQKWISIHEDQLGIALDDPHRLNLLIKDKGISAFWFQQYRPQLQEFKDELLNINDSDMFQKQSESSPLLNLASAFETLVATIDSANGVPYILNDPLEITFNSAGITSQLNLPVPTSGRRAHITYFECKLIQFTPTKDKAKSKLDDNSILPMFIGLSSTKSLPNWILPGQVPFSIAINSNGELINNQNYAKNIDSPVVTPSWQQGDVIGMGYDHTKGVIFITYNGRNRVDVISGWYGELWLMISGGELGDHDGLGLVLGNNSISNGNNLLASLNVNAVNSWSDDSSRSNMSMGNAGFNMGSRNASGNGNINGRVNNENEGNRNRNRNRKHKPTIVDVNLGQMGFVWIEANVKKYGFCEGKIDGDRGPAPGYKSVRHHRSIDYEDMRPSGEIDTLTIGSYQSTCNSGCEGSQEGELLDRWVPEYTDPPKYIYNEKL